MKVTVNRKELLNAWKAAASAIPTKTPIDALKSVKVTAEGSSLSVVGTDLQVVVRCEIDAEVEKPGECLLPADRGLSFLQAATSESVLIRSVGTAVDLVSGSAKTSLQTAHVQDFPPHGLVPPSGFEVPADELRACLAFAAPAVDREGRMAATSAAAEGVYIGHWNGQLIIAATDRRNFAIQMSVQVDEFPGVTLPEDAIGCIRGAGLKGPVVITITGAKAQFSAVGITISVPLLQGDWPTYCLPILESRKVLATCRIGAGAWRSLLDQVAATLLPEACEASVDFAQEIRLSNESAAGRSETSSPCEFSGAASRLGVDLSPLAKGSRSFGPADVLEIEACDVMNEGKVGAIAVRSGNRTLVVAGLE